LQEWTARRRRNWRRGEDVMESGFTVSISPVSFFKGKKNKNEDEERERDKKRKSRDGEAKEEKRSSPRFVLCWRLEVMWGFAIVESL
jgi:hypothetical protein